MRRSSKPGQARKRRALLQGLAKYFWSVRTEISTRRTVPVKEALMNAVKARHPEMWRALIIYDGFLLQVVHFCFCRVLAALSQGDRVVLSLQPRQSPLLQAVQ